MSCCRRPFEAWGCAAPRAKKNRRTSSNGSTLPLIPRPDEREVGIEILKEQAALSEKLAMVNDALEVRCNSAEQRLANLTLPADSPRAEDFDSRAPGDGGFGGEEGPKLDVSETAKACDDGVDGKSGLEGESDDEYETFVQSNADLPFARAMDLGVQAFGRKDMLRAKRCFRLAVHCTSEHNAELSRARAYGNLSNVYCAERRHAKAMLYFKRAIEIVRREKERDLENVLISNGVVCCVQLQRYDEALGLALRKLAISRSEAERRTSKQWIDTLNHVISGTVDLDLQAPMAGLLESSTCINVRDAFDSVSHRAPLSMAESEDCSPGAEDVKTPLVTSNFASGDGFCGLSATESSASSVVESRGRTSSPSAMLRSFSEGHDNSIDFDTFDFEAASWFEDTPLDDSAYPHTLLTLPQSDQGEIEPHKLLSPEEGASRSAQTDSACFAAAAAAASSTSTDSWERDVKQETVPAGSESVERADVRAPYDGSLQTTSSEKAAPSKETQVETERSATQEHRSTEKAHLGSPRGMPCSGKAAHDMVSYRARLMRFYKRHNPKKLRDIDMLLKKYGEHEEVLFQRLEMKYGLAPGSTRYH